MRAELTGRGALVAVSILAALLTCAACGGRMPTKRYYAIDDPPRPAAAAANASPVCEVPLVVASVMAAAPYRNDKIVFRSDAYEIRHFNYRLWVTPPDEMMHSLLIRTLDASDLFPVVESYVHASSDHLALYARIDAIEEIDTEDGWSARLAMSFHLKRSDADDLLWRYEFDATEPVAEESIPAVVAALSGIYRAKTEELTAELRRFLATYPGCRPTPEPEE
ncbi:MAG: ABC-type transport auxiliary lipoprotein family protein [Polyangia bacterium]